MAIPCSFWQKRADTTCTTWPALEIDLLLVCFTCRNVSLCQGAWGEARLWKCSLGKVNWIWDKLHIRVAANTNNFWIPQNGEAAGEQCLLGLLTSQKESEERPPNKERAWCSKSGDMVKQCLARHWMYDVQSGSPSAGTTMSLLSNFLTFDPTASH